MEFFHYISGNRAIDSRLFDFLEKQNYPMKIVNPSNGNELSAIFAFQMYESDPLWPQVDDIISDYDEKNGPVVNRMDTHFSEEELREARWAWIGATFEQLDPMPMFRWIRDGLTFRLECQECWIYEQIAPFRIKKEPLWKKNMFLRLISVGEIFAKPEVVSEFTQQGFIGFKDGDVLIHKTGFPAETIRQMYFNVSCPVPVYNKADLVEMVCPVCGRIRYLPHMRGTFQYKESDLEPINTDFLQMQEWIGNGGINWHETLVSNRVVQHILDQKWQGIQLKAIELV